MSYAASGFRHKLQSRVESLSLENLNISLEQESRQGSRRIQILKQIAYSRQGFESGKSGHKV